MTYTVWYRFSPQCREGWLHIRTVFYSLSDAHAELAYIWSGDGEYGVIESAYDNPGKPHVQHYNGSNPEHRATVQRLAAGGNRLNGRRIVSGRISDYTVGGQLAA